MVLNKSDKKSDKKLLQKEIISQLQLSYNLHSMCLFMHLFVPHFWSNYSYAFSNYAPLGESFKNKKDLVGIAHFLPCAEIGPGPEND